MIPNLILNNTVDSKRVDTRLSSKKREKRLSLVSSRSPATARITNENRWSTVRRKDRKITTQFLLNKPSFYSQIKTKQTQFTKLTFIRRRAKTSAIASDSRGIIMSQLRRYLTQHSTCNFIRS